MSRVDYGKIDVEQFLNELGMRNVKKDGNEVFFSCPFGGHSNGDITPSASMQQGTTKIHCFGCGFSGNAVIFLAEHENCSPLKASRFIREWLGDDFREPEGSFREEIERLLNKSPQEKRELRNQPIDKSEIEKRKVDWRSLFLEKDYMLSRGFHWQTLEEWDIGWDRIEERYSIPWFDIDGELIGFKGRLGDEEPGPGRARYKVLGGIEYGFDTFDIAKMLYGANKLEDWHDWFNTDRIILREGELNVVALHQMGIGPTIGLSGKHVSEEQVYLLKKISSGRKLYIYLDDHDDAQTAAEKLVRYMPVYIMPSGDKDPADSTKEEVEELLSGAKNAIMHV